MAYVIVPCHPQRDSTYSNHCFCTLCMLNVCLLFCDNKWGRGLLGGGSFLLCFFSELLDQSQSLETQVERGTVKQATIKFTGKLSPCHKTFLFWIPKGFIFPNKLGKGDQFCAPPNDSALKHGSHLWTATPEVGTSRDFNLHLCIGNPVECNCYCCTLHK